MSSRMSFSLGSVTPPAPAPFKVMLLMVSPVPPQMARSGLGVAHPLQVHHGRIRAQLLEYPVAAHRRVAFVAGLVLLLHVLVELDPLAPPLLRDLRVRIGEVAERD